MKEEKIKFIKKGLVFFVMFILILLILNDIFTKLILQEKLISKKELHYREFFSNLSNKEIDFAFFGDSHTINGINPSFIPKSFNLAFYGERYTESYYKLKRALEIDKIKIKNIVLEIDLNTFTTPDVSPNFINHLEIYSKFVPYSEISKVNNQSIISVWFESNLPIIGNGLLIRDRFRKNPFGESFYYGWQPDNSRSGALQICSKDIERPFEKLQIIDKVPFEYFIKTLELAKSKGINIIFIKTPMSEEFDYRINIYNLSKEGYYNEIFAEVNKVIGRDYLVLDYYDLFFNKPEYFSGDTHLSPTGAEILSKKIYKDLKKYNLTK